MTVPVGVPTTKPALRAFTHEPARPRRRQQWINMFYGPLSTVNPGTARGATGYKRTAATHDAAEGRTDRTAGTVRRRGVAEADPRGVPTMRKG